MGSNFKYDNSTGTYLPDMSELTLFCEGKKVGTCMLDLVSYIDRKPVVEKVSIASNEALSNTDNLKVLAGDAT